MLQGAQSSKPYSPAIREFERKILEHMSLREPALGPHN